MSDWLRTGQSGARIPVEARFSLPVQTGTGRSLIFVFHVSLITRGLIGSKFYCISLFYIYYGLAGLT